MDPVQEAPGSTLGITRMFRFTIRDVLWLMVVVGMACGWWMESSAASKVRAENLLLKRSDTSKLREQLQSAWWHYGPGFRSGYSPEVDWSVLGPEYAPPTQQQSQR